ncbi:MAG TPA: aminotransferase class I/II-fold pyridoxal phosphate-dependent enzyme, partial [Kofleriaceae bacterium]|nr:aminotransferase class I/II-fold pyridoxal phosphate-dependent enzyme [Kofleriaceae bacterium]
AWFLERPSLERDAFADLAALDRLCDDAARAGADVIVDESNANYCPPAYSATTLATSRDNLAVLRGWAKAYGLGGLRLGVCVASPALTARIRELVPPLSASSLSLRIGARLLAAGDLTAPLRARIAAHKPEALRLFAGDATAASEHLPYILSLTRRDTPTIAGKLHPIYVAKTGSVHHLRRFSVPLAPDRMARLRNLLG